MQRLHEEDLAGYVLETGSWRHLDLPATAVEDQQIRIGPGPDDIKYRGEGDLLHPEREPEEALERLRVELGSIAFSAQYQQRPVPLEGNLVRRHWFRWYQQRPGSGELRRIVQSRDIAGTTGERRDYSVCTTWLVDGRNCYLLDAWRGRLEYPDLRRKVVALRRQHAAQTILIEKAGLGLNLVQDLQRERPDDLPRPIGIEPRGDKADRMAAASARIEAGEVLLPEEAPWLDMFLHELLAFPNGRHDDQVDSVSQFLNWERKRQDDVPLNAIVETIPNPINSLLGHHRW